MDQYKPPGLIKKIYFKNLSFGDAPFKIENVWVEDEGEKHVLMEVHNLLCRMGFIENAKCVNAVPVPGVKAQQIAGQIKAQRKDIRVSFGNNAVACPNKPPLVEAGMIALSKDGLSMLFFAYVAEHQGVTGGQRKEAKILVGSGATHCYMFEAYVRRHGFKEVSQVSTSLFLVLTGTDLFHLLEAMSPHVSFEHIAMCRARVH